MQKKIICLCLLLALGTAQLTVNLARQEVIDTTTNSKSDIIYTYQTEDKVKVIFDTRAKGDYVASFEANQGTLTDEVLGQTQKIKPSSESQEALKINGKKTSPLTFNAISAPTQYQKLVDRIVGLQIPSVEQEKYFQKRLGDTIKTKHQSFSFFFSPNGKVNKIFFGEIQNYLTESLITFPVSYQTANNRWQLTVTDLKKVGATETIFKPTAPVTAIFDSTTSKILVDSNTYAEIIRQVTNLGDKIDKTKCATVKSGNHVFSFVFKLSNQDQSSQEKISTNQFKVKLNDLLLEQTDGSCTLLIQKTTDNNQPWVLGTTFLQNVYTYFNYDAHNIQLSNIRALPIDAPTTDGTWGTVFIVLGILLALLSLAALLALIQPIKYVPQPQVQQPKQVQQSVVQQYIAQPQRVFVVQQPVTYSINQSVVGQSPTRYVPQGFQTVVRPQ